jgi:hypothetical protein
MVSLLYFQKMRSLNFNFLSVIENAVYESSLKNIIHQYIPISRQYLLQVLQYSRRQHLSHN